MYANLRVTVSGDTPGEYWAWKVEVDEDGTTTIHTDDQNGTGSYADPGPERKFGPGHVITIHPDF